MHKPQSTDYETYREIMDELLQPISGDDLDADTLRRLYESKMVYLENLRRKCFQELNAAHGGHFTTDDYQLILAAAKETGRHLRELILTTIASTLDSRKIS